MKFFIGLHNVHHAKLFDRSFISINRLKNRYSDFATNSWILDSSAFTTVSKYGGYLQGCDVYSRQIIRWQRCGTMLAAVTQDYMCEEFVLEKTGLSVLDHQRLTIERFIKIFSNISKLANYYNTTQPYLMPVIQGYKPEEYIKHLHDWAPLIKKTSWIGVGSICKRNSNPSAIYEILYKIKRLAPDLRLHGFGLKTTSLIDTDIQRLLYSTDSMAWSFAARREGRDANSYEEAIKFKNRIESLCIEH